MSQPDIRLTSDSIRRHADAVDSVADLLREAGSAAAFVDASDDAYGILCSPLFVPRLNPLQDDAYTQYRDMEDTTRRLADLLRDVADGYDLTDELSAETFRRIDW